MSDKRKDRHTPEQRSFNMSRIRSSGTKLELAFFRLLTENNFTFMAHPKKISGKPDCLIQPNILVFVDSDFWHGWHFQQWRDRLPKDYWVEKIERNIRRDYQKFRALRSEGYIVVRVWEHSLKKSPEQVVEALKKAIEKSQKQSA